MEELSKKVPAADFIIHVIYMYVVKHLMWISSSNAFTCCYEKNNKDSVIGKVNEENTWAGKWACRNTRYNSAAAPQRAAHHASYLACRQVSPACQEKLASNPQQHIFALNRLFPAAMGPIRIDSNSTYPSWRTLTLSTRYTTSVLHMR
jgi:hypothetical protein